MNSSNARDLIVPTHDADHSVEHEESDSSHALQPILNWIFEDARQAPNLFLGDCLVPGGGE